MIWFFLAGMIAGAAGLYLLAAYFVRKDTEEMDCYRKFEEDHPDALKHIVVDQDILNGIEHMTIRMTCGKYLTTEDVVKICEIYDNALERRKAEMKEAETVDRSGV